MVRSILFMKVHIVCLFVVALYGQPAFSQTITHDLIFYNVENLFDTIDDPLINDEEFLPGGRYRWDGVRYLHKLDQLSRVISNDGHGPLPVIVGLCEIENRAVLEDLAATERLKGAGYAIVHHDSPDERGIDVALLYQSAHFRVLVSYPLPVKLPYDLEFKTRDILYVRGIMGIDTIHLYVNHWPSRRGGADVSEVRRVQAASVLRQHLDLMAPQFRQFHVVIMGDLNDEPGDRSVSEVLGARSFGSECPDESKTCLCNLSSLIPEGMGTYHYWRDKKWNVLDHIIVSSSLLDSSAMRADGNVRYLWGSFNVLQESWLLKEDNGVMVPLSSFARDYQGGFSDHLPVKMTLTVKTAPIGESRKWQRKKAKK
jgi:endonuclease/exonuclease/phosphatase family metal-dependent hydrolase